MKAFAALMLGFSLLAKFHGFPQNAHGRHKRPGRSRADPNIFVRNGVLFQIGGCPQAITSAEAEARKSNHWSLNNKNVIILQKNRIGRSGNHFVNLSQYLAMGYCCKSKVLELPARDKAFATNNGTFESKNRFFDFSNVGKVPLQEHATLAERPDVCQPEMIFGGDIGSYKLEGIHPDLKACIARVYLRGCEALYLGDMVDVSKVCGAQAKVSEVETESVLKNGNAGCRNHVLHQDEVVVGEERPTLDLLGNSGGGLSAGSLVIHIRSGDIFNLKTIRRLKLITEFGQPPLEYYLRVISSQSWSKVSILTSGGQYRLLNPVYVALKNMTITGQLGPNVILHHDRSLIADFHEMICADALALSRSSLHLLTTAFTRASTIFLPMECGSGSYTRGEHVNKVAAENSTVLKLERPQTKVYGVEWSAGQESYSVYGNWRSTKQQIEEMLKPDIVKGLQQCCI